MCKLYVTLGESQVIGHGSRLGDSSGVGFCSDTNGPACVCRLWLQQTALAGVCC